MRCTEGGEAQGEDVEAGGHAADQPGLGHGARPAPPTAARLPTRILREIIYRYL